MFVYFTDFVREVINFDPPEFILRVDAALLAVVNFFPGPNQILTSLFAISKSLHECTGMVNLDAFRGFEAVVNEVKHDRWIRPAPPPFIFFRQQ